MPYPRIALYPGSFDPFTIGHEALVRRALPLFDKIVVAVGVNSDKQYMYTAEERVEMARRRLAGLSAVEVCSYADMTVDCCRRWGAKFILRGIRNAADLAYETQVAAVNRALDGGIETVILLATPDMADISSTIERERILHQSNPSHTV